MDSYYHRSLVYYPKTESEQEEDIGSPSPDHQTSTPPAARSMFDMRADWFRSNGLRLRASEPPPLTDPYQAPHRHNQLPSPLRDPYLAPDPYHPNPRARQVMAPTSAIGVPVDATHQYVSTAEFMRQGMEHGIRHNLLGQRVDSLLGQVRYQEDLISKSRYPH
ncbi:hypothetical protein L1987_46699 [Smallanthus sonchifolius]|uniref:Uncharacterized protein n=1 Tax=Smallanthus sonchifolius TaxID=185202 RepID=A0ACB9G068_9ASTR|nr:hypothetical protein L1987_46699 [Smallanthus sonchifolius]